MLRLRAFVVSILLGMTGAFAIGVAAHASTTATYTYDTLGRLDTAVYFDGTTGKTITYNYTYDPAGNRTLVNVTVG